MAQTYQLTFGRRLVNAFISALVRLGVNLRGTYLLSVAGRKSGKIYTTPVTLVEQGGQRWLVAPYGEVNRVRNAQAAGRVTLGRGRQSETVTIVELGPQERAPMRKRVPQAGPDRAALLRCHSRLASGGLRSGSSPPSRLSHRWTGDKLN